jgi:hypothetical protein
MNALFVVSTSTANSELGANRFSRLKLPDLELRFDVPVSELNPGQKNLLRWHVESGPRDEHGRDKAEAVVIDADVDISLEIFLHLVRCSPKKIVIVSRRTLPLGHADFATFHQVDVSQMRPPDRY